MRDPAKVNRCSERPPLNVMLVRGVSSCRSVMAAIVAVLSSCSYRLSPSKVAFSSNLTWVHAPRTPMNVLAEPRTSALAAYVGSLRWARASISNPGRVLVLTHVALVPSARRWSGAFQLTE